MISLAIISVPAPAPRRKPTIRNRGRVPSVLSTQYPTKTPISVVTRSVTPVSEKRTRYTQPRPGAVMGDLIRPRQYSRGRCARPLLAGSSKDGHGVEIEATATERPTWRVPLAHTHRPRVPRGDRSRHGWAGTTRDRMRRRSRGRRTAG